MNPRFFTPLRYPGGKAGLGQWIAYLMRSNNINGGTYVEPYAGGAGVALYLLLNEYVKKIIINDADPLIFSFWNSVLNETEDFIHRIESTPINVDIWKKQKLVSQFSDQSTSLEKGFSAFFLNRTNRSGILKGGVIGGLKQTGNYKIDARFNKKDLIKRIEKIANKRDQIELTGIDALALIKSHSKKKEERSLIYLDPPYYNKGSQLYRNFYKPQDHREISRAIKKIPTPWLVTYDNCNEIKELYKDQHSINFSLIYSTNVERPMATESMIYGNLQIPRKPELARSTKPYPKKWDTAA